MANDPRLGISAPMSTEPPNQRDLKLDEALLHELKARNNFEPQEETNRRRMVLQRLDGLLKQMVTMVGKQQGLPNGILNDAGGKIFTYGSYELGVYGPGSDIDTLMVAPKHVSRDNFFQYMPDLVRKEFKSDEIGELVPVPGISVPIIKLELCGVSVDLIFCSLGLQTISKTLELSDLNLLRGLDEVDLRCVNGTRVAKRLLELVPQTKVFRMALRAIKVWAKQRALYGNIIGFPGGIAYAIMVARICQLYPKAAAPLIIWKFFYLMQKWHWPNPVLLQHREEAPFQLKEWNPAVYFGEKKELMPVITPAYPQQNSIHTIGPSTRTVLLSEMGRAETIVNGVYDNSRSWKDLFQRHSFFTDAYKHYICVVTASKTKGAQQAWSGLVESRVKFLVKFVEELATGIELVHPFNKGYNRVHECKGDAEIDKTLDGGLDSQVKDIKTETTEQAADVSYQVAAQADADGKEAPMADVAMPEPGDGPQAVWTTTFYLGIGLKPDATNMNIFEPIQMFYKKCKGWENYDENLHSVRVKHMRNFDLPADVFVEGDVRPPAPKQKKAPKAKGGKKKTSQDTMMDDATSKKRSFTETGLDENNDPAKRRVSANGPSSKTMPNGAAPPNGASR